MEPLRPSWHPASREECSRCGTALVLQCGHCESGAGPVRPEPAHPASRVERRYLTIMFCDLVNSTRLATRLDPEDLLELVRAYHALCVEIIKNYDGFLASFMGDGFMSYFGYPRARRDDAERAACAALDLIASIKTGIAGPVDGSDNSISTRIGIASGLVVVGNLSGNGAAERETAIGATPNLAARLQALAQPDTVVVSAETRNLIQNRFTLKNIGFHLLPGFEKSHGLWQVIDASDPGDGFYHDRGEE